MMQCLRHKKLSSCLLIACMLSMLLFPVFHSRAETVYSPDYTLPNLLAVLAIAALAAEKQLKLNQRHLPMVGVLLVLLGGFNFILGYYNYFYFQWFNGQINATIPVLLFTALLCRREEALAAQQDLAELFVKLFVLTNLVGLIPYVFEYGFFDFRLQVMEFVSFKGLFDERRYSWIFIHKSQYALMLLLGLGLVVTYRHVFRKKWQYFASLIILLAGLVISNTRTSMVASLLIFGGMLMDYILARPEAQRKKYLLGFIPLGAVLAVLLYMISQRRNIWTLGGRTYIWLNALPFLWANRLGLATQSGYVSYPVPDWPYEVQNCHNVFLNWMMQFSVPGGAVLVLIFLLILCVAVWRNRSFCTLGIWAAILVAMCMDWSLLLGDMTLLFTGLYFLFFCPLRTKEMQ